MSAAVYDRYCFVYEIHYVHIYMCVILLLKICIFRHLYHLKTSVEFSCVVEALDLESEMRSINTSRHFKCIFLHMLLQISGVMFFNKMGAIMHWVLFDFSCEFSKKIIYMQFTQCSIVCFSICLDREFYCIASVDRALMCGLQKLLQFEQQCVYI